MLMGVNTRQPNGVLIRVSAAVSEENFIHAIRCQVGDQLGRFATLVIGMLRGDGRQSRSLVLNGLYDFRVLMTDVDVHQLRGEIQVPIALVIPHIATLGRGRRERVQGALRTPGVKDMGSV